MLFKQCGFRFVSDICSGGSKESVIVWDTDFPYTIVPIEIAQNIISDGCIVDVLRFLMSTVQSLAVEYKGMIVPVVPTELKSVNIGGTNIQTFYCFLCDSANITNAVLGMDVTRNCMITHKYNGIDLHIRDSVLWYSDWTKLSDEVPQLKVYSVLHDLKEIQRTSGQVMNLLKEMR